MTIVVGVVVMVCAHVRGMHSIHVYNCKEGKRNRAHGCMLAMQR